MKDKYIKKISILSFVEMILLIALIFFVFNYYIGIQGGDYLFNETINIIIISFLVICLIVIYIVKFILKRKRFKFLMKYDKF